MFKFIKPLSDGIGQFIRRYAPAIITLIVIGAAFYFYSNVIIKQNERNIRERSFRGLNRIGSNIREKIEGYAERNSINFLSAVDTLHPIPGQPGPNPLLNRIEGEYGLRLVSDTTPTDNYFTIRQRDSWNFIFGTKPDQRAVAPVNDFIRSYLRRDLFRYFFLAHNDTVLFDDINLSHDTLTPIAQGNEVKDSVTGELTREFGAIRQVETGGKKYKVFMTPFTVKGKHRFVIGGYMPVEDYYAESRFIPGNAILWLVLGIVLVILMFPLLKIFLMTRSEPLLARNVLTSLISIHLIGSILIIILVNIYAYYFLIRRPSDDQLRTLATNIQQTFLSEVKDALGEMEESERELLKLINQQGARLDGRLPDLYAPVNQSGFFIDLAGKTPTPVPDIPYKPDSLGTRYPYFEHIVWTNSAGMQTIRWTRNPFVPTKVNLKDRDYFQAVTQGSLIRRDQQEFFLTAVTSWVSQQKLAIIARKSRLRQLLQQTNLITDTTLRKQWQAKLDNIEMISLSTPMRSIFNPVLPYGFGFCLVDGRGNVYFHYDENRSLNENLVEECSDNVKLNSLLTTGASGYYNAHYTGSNHRFYAQPIDRMPFYLVTFYDVENNWNQDLDIMSASSILVLINMGIILLLVLITRVLSFRRLSRSILFIWVEPKRHRGNAYIKATWAFALASVLLFLFAFISNRADELYLLGISLGFTHILIVYSYRVYTREDLALDKETGTGPIRQYRGRKIEHTITILIGLYLLAAGLFMSNLTDGAGIFLSSQILLVVGCWLISRYVVAPGSIRGIKRYQKYYYNSLFSFIMATAVVPTLLFFSLSFREEQKLAIKYQQLDFVNNLLNKKPYRDYANDSNWQVSYRRPFHYDFLADRIERDQHTDTLRWAITRFSRLYNVIKPSFSNYARRIEYLNNEDSMVGNFTWNDTANPNSLRFRIDILRTRTYADGDYRLSAVKNIYPVSHQLGERFMRDPEIHILLLLIICLLLAGIYLLLQQLIPRVFFFNRSEFSAREMINKTFIRSLNPVNHVYILGMINSGKFNLINLSLKDDGYTIFTLDIALMFAVDPDKPETTLFQQQWKGITDAIGKLTPEELAQRKTAVVIRHFEMKMDDLAATEDKLKVVERLLAYKYIRLVVSSSRHFEAMVVKEPPPADNPTKPVKDLTDRWLNVMNNFCLYYHKWHYAGAKQQTTDAAWEKNYDVYFLGRQLNEKLYRECAHSEFLYGLLAPLRQSLVREWLPKAKVLMGEKEKIGKPGTEDLFNSFLIKLEAMAYPYYLSLWQTLTAEEQRTLYDIASDGLLNQRNQDVADNLHALGLLRINGSATGYWTMNESFRAFVLKRIDKNELTKMREGADPSHSWNRFQLPVIIVVIAVALFLFTTQRDAFNNLITYLAAAAGGIAALLKILDAFSGPKAKTP
ncbi:hypothetical protein [Paraflavitalea pollutisoli]|uniref:hypothetical protein n=1 Tax=Paraflavitalea pollutisoli TaxID=3034143 RepID=UPI0023ECC16E|nr:hypothetical protein [Paraflavitalea sp. H1-2-19X]